MKLTDEIQSRIDEAQEMLQRMQLLEPLLASTGLLHKCTMYGDIVDIEETTHEESVLFIKTLGGRWDKEYMESKINYERAEKLHGFRVRIWQGEPPASCKIVEVEEYFPETIIAAHTRKVRKLQCVEFVAAE